MNSAIADLKPSPAIAELSAPSAVGSDLLDDGHIFSRKVAVEIAQINLDTTKRLIALRQRIEARLKIVDAALAEGTNKDGEGPKFKVGDRVSVPVRFGETGTVKEIKDGRYGVEFQNLPFTLWYDENELRPQVGKGFSWAR